MSLTAGNISSNISRNLTSSTATENGPNLHSLSTSLASTTNRIPTSPPTRSHSSCRLASWWWTVCYSSRTEAEEARRVDDVEGALEAEPGEGGKGVAEQGVAQGEELRFDVCGCELLEWGAVGGEGARMSWARQVSSSR
ncbi:MAG: hypothetical protein Q9167_006932 [Letrouitia subvulpina]